MQIVSLPTVQLHMCHEHKSTIIPLLNILGVFSVNNYYLKKKVNREMIAESK